MKINATSLYNNNFQLVPPPRKQQKAQIDSPINRESIRNIYYYPHLNINFCASNKDRVSINNIDFFDYKNMSETTKRIHRKKCKDFARNVDSSQLPNPNKKYLPLMDDKVMEQFIDVCKIYKGLKNEPILCLGRSPKWFLNGALWMKDGIEDYKFVAFSKFWYRKDGYGNLVKIKSMEPTPEEKKAFKRYLRTMRATPKNIVDVYQKTGKKIIITDYINSGKGVSSFLDLMSEYAEEDGILEEFANSFKICGIGCMEYMEKFYHDDESIPIPRVPLPERLWPYERKIEQEFHDMPIEVFKEMLINENSNECRSSYYPHEAWTVYKPYNVKTGMIAQKKIDELKERAPKSLNNFNPAMRDYRNLLNFRILDYMENNGLLKESLNSKQWD